MSILLIILSLYLKWWILFGVSIALLIIVAIALSIYENILRRVLKNNFKKLCILSIDVVTIIL